MRRGILDDFWGILVPTLVGKSFYTLKRKHEFRVEEMGENHLRIVASTGNHRRIPRRELEGAWQALTRNGQLTPQQIREQSSQFNPTYVAAILAHLPGVEHQANPVILFYREAK